MFDAMPKQWHARDARWNFWYAVYGGRKEKMCQCPLCLRFMTQKRCSDHLRKTIRGASTCLKDEYRFPQDHEGFVCPFGDFECKLKVELMRHLSEKHPDRDSLKAWGICKEAIRIQVDYHDHVEQIDEEARLGKRKRARSGDRALLVLLKQRQTEQKRIHVLECDANWLKREAKNMMKKAKDLRENIKKAKEELDAKRANNDYTKKQE